MALRHLLLRYSPTIDGRWVIALVVLGVLILAGTMIRWTGPAPPLDLVALGPEGEFQATLRVPREWGDTATHTPDAVARIPLILGVLNRGRRPVQPERLSLSVPLRYRLTGPSGEELEGRMEEGSPLITYTLASTLPIIEPQRLPALLTRYDTLWLEVVIPSYYCVAVADSIPEFIPAPPAPVRTMSEVRIFYSFEGGNLRDRRTGTLAVHMDSSLLMVDPPSAPPTFDMVVDPELASPDLASLQRVGSRRSQCGEPGSAMELLSTVWETPGGGRFIALDYGGTVRKHLYDLDGDGVIERETWRAGSGDAFTATRRTALPIPAFLLPVAPGGAYDLARIDTLPPDSAQRLDPFRRAMTGPGAVPGGVAGTGADSIREAQVPPTVRRAITGDTARTPAAVGRPATEPAVRDTPSRPTPRPAGPLGRPVDPDTVPGAPPGV